MSEVQEQIDNLDSGPSPYTRDPSQVAEFLSSKKAILTMIYDAAVRHSIRFVACINSYTMMILIQSSILNADYDKNIM